MNEEEYMKIALNEAKKAYNKKISRIFLGEGREVLGPGHFSL